MPFLQELNAFTHHYTKNDINQYHDTVADNW